MDRGGLQGEAELARNAPYAVAHEANFQDDTKARGESAVVRMPR